MSNSEASQATATVGNVTQKGAPRKRAPKVDYPFKRMEVGAIVTMDGDTRTIKDALRQYAKYNKTKAFRADKTPLGVKIVRTA